MKIAIANDVAMAAEALRRVVASTAEHQVLWIARTGAEAVRMCADQRPDLILMDLNMPELDGVEATRQIMEQSPCAILVVTGRPQDNVNQVFRALGAGALDVTATPVLQGQPGGDAELLAKIRTMDKLIRHSGGNQAMPPRSALPPAAAAVAYQLVHGSVFVGRGGCHVNEAPSATTDDVGGLLAARLDLNLIHIFTGAV